MNRFGVIGVLIGVLAGSSVAQVASDDKPQLPPQQQRVVHPYFRDVAHYILPAADETSVTIDGFLMPREVHLSCERAGDIEEARLLEFVLVLPQKFDLDGFAFEVQRPYYIAKTELSNAQRAEVGFPSGSWQSYEMYASMVNFRARMEFDNEPKDLQRIGDYIADPDNPAVTLGLSEALFSARRLSGVAGVTVRLPTLAEWYAAMRGGASTRYWWGDKCDFEKIAWNNVRDVRERNTIESIRSVYEGPENPIGLRNMIGNAGEIVFPTIEEREQLRSFAMDVEVFNLEGRADIPRAVVHPQTGFVVGGDVSTTRGRKEDFDRSMTSWEYLPINQITENGVWLFYRQWCSGVRFVLEAPLGDIVIKN